MTAAQCGHGKKNWHESVGISAPVSRPQWAQVIREVVVIAAIRRSPSHPRERDYSPGSNGALSFASALNAANRSLGIRVPAASA